MIVDSAIYVDGRRAESHPPEGVRRACRENGGFAWIGLYEPTEEELDSVVSEFDLQELAVGDAKEAHRRPKVERYGDCLFLVLKSAHYRDETETVEFGEIHAFVATDFIVTVRRGESSAPHEARKRSEGDRDLLRRGPVAALYAVVERVVNDYDPVIDGLENDVDEIEEEVLGSATDASRRIYGLSREVIGFHRATRPLAATLEYLIEDKTRVPDPEIKRRLRNVRGRALRVTEQAESLRELLQNILGVNLTLVGVEQNSRMQRQNDQVQKVSAWAAILVVPTIITGVYGMNFRHMPELDWLFGYPYALVLMATVSGILYLGFKRSGWL